MQQVNVTEGQRARLAHKDLTATAFLDLSVPGNPAWNTVVEAREQGTGGNSISIASVADGAGAGSVTTAGNVITVHYQTLVTTVGNIEALFNAHALIRVRTPGTAANVLTSPGDTFAATSLAGGSLNYVVERLTQLVSARMSEPRQWVITLMQPVTGRSGVNPWISTFDGGAYPPTGTNIMTAPTLPVGTSLQVSLRWGAGGVAFDTLFDYPVAGGTFGVTGDSLDLDVTFRGSAPTYNSLDLVPVVGAFMVEGLAADPTPLRWRELDPTGFTGLTAIGAGGDAFWAVKPFSRRVRLASGDVTTRWRVDFLDAAGALLWAERYNLGGIGDARVITVPAAAAVMRVIDNGVGSTWAIEWEIGLT